MLTPSNLCEYELLNNVYVFIYLYTTKSWLGRSGPKLHRSGNLPEKIPLSILLNIKKFSSPERLVECFSLVKI